MARIAVGDVAARAGKHPGGGLVRRLADGGGSQRDRDDAGFNARRGDTGPVRARRRQRLGARTLLISLPGLLLVWGLVALLASRLEQVLPPLMPSTRGHRSLELGSGWLRLIGCLMLLIALAAPLASLIWKLGLAGMPPHWNRVTARHFLNTAAATDGATVLHTMGTAMAGGTLVAGLALIGCWLARESRWFRWLLFGVSTWAWVMPASVVGIGLKELIQEIVQAWPAGPLADLLYFAPSPLPVMWAQGLRMLPIAVVFLWPVVRMITASYSRKPGSAGRARAANSRTWSGR